MPFYYVSRECNALPNGRATAPEHATRLLRR
jgi:hypothetical protein